MKDDPEVLLRQTVGEYALDPLGYAAFVFPWGEDGTDLADKRGVRRWQGDVLHTIGQHLRARTSRFTPLRLAVASGHGIGKSALISMIACWAMDTCVDTRVVVTANTEGQLLTKTGPEIMKWRKLSLTRDMWKPTVTKIGARDPDHADSWRLDLVTWSEHNTEAFAGLHNEGKRIVIIYDEASNIADKVWEVTEGALTDENTEIIWIAFGNPTRNTGRFRECFGRYRHLWVTKQIDSRTVEGTNTEYLQGMVDTYGADSDIAKVRVLGQFPSASSMQFIGSGLVSGAKERVIAETSILPSDPVIFGLDHARFGDDASVLAIRQGRDARSRPWKVWRGANSMQIAGDLNDQMQRFLPDAVFIDAGGPNAGGVIDRLRQLNPEHQGIFEINFGSSSPEMTAELNGERVRVANKRAQMWTNMRTWLDRSAIPSMMELADDLIGPEYSYDARNAILLEKKDHMKARGVPSPDHGDALALTFAEAVPPRTVPNYLKPENYPGSREAKFDRYREVEYTDMRQSAGFDRYGELD